MLTEKIQKVRRRIDGRLSERANSLLMVRKIFDSWNLPESFVERLMSSIQKESRLPPDCTEFFFEELAKATFREHVEGQLVPEADANVRKCCYCEKCGIEHDVTTVTSWTQEDFFGQKLYYPKRVYSVHHDNGTVGRLSDATLEKYNARTLSEVHKIVHGLVTAAEIRAYLAVTSLDAATLDLLLGWQKKTTEGLLFGFIQNDTEDAALCDLISCPENLLSTIEALPDTVDADEEKLCAAIQRSPLLIQRRSD